MVREEQLLKRIQELETENEKLRTQLNRRTSGAVDGAAEQTRAKYADRILDTLPDMMTVWTNSGVITDLISSEETNHVGVPSERFIGMNIRELLLIETCGPIWITCSKRKEVLPGGTT